MYKFEKLKVWNESNKLIEMAYQFIKELPTNEKYNASDQLRRAVFSISLNIADLIYFKKIFVRGCEYH